MAAMALSPSKRWSKSNSVALKPISTTARTMSRVVNSFMAISIEEFLDIRGEELHGYGQEDHPKNFLDNGDAAFPKEAL